MLGYSVITEIELLSFPSLSKENKALIRDHLNDFHWVTLDADITQQTILLRRQHRLKIPDAILRSKMQY